MFGHLLWPCFHVLCEHMTCYCVYFYMPRVPPTIFILITLLIFLPVYSPCVPCPMPDCWFPVVSCPAVPECFPLQGIVFYKYDNAC